MGRGRRSIGYRRRTELQAPLRERANLLAIRSGSMPGSAPARRVHLAAAVLAAGEQAGPGAPERAQHGRAGSGSAPARAHRAARRRPAPGSARLAARPALARRATRSRWRAHRARGRSWADGARRRWPRSPAPRSAADSGRRLRPRRVGRWLGAVPGVLRRMHRGGRAMAVRPHVAGRARGIVAGSAGPDGLDVARRAHHGAQDHLGPGALLEAVDLERGLLHSGMSDHTDRTASQPRR